MTEEFKLTKEQKKQQEQYVKEYERLLSRYAPPHNKKAKRVTEKDIKRVIKDGRDMMTMCTIPRGNYQFFDALAHTQIDDKKPLRFFVFANGFMVINPLIINHTKVAVFNNEGCMSFADEPMKTMVPRYYKITIEYQTLLQDAKTKKYKLSDFVTEELKGQQSFIFQHECAHLNGSNIYDDVSDPIHAVGLGNGILLTSKTWDK